MGRKGHDCFSAEKRSEVMSRIKGRNTRPERALRSALWATGLRYRIHPALFGKPDIAFLKHRILVFVDGCFWHGCPLHGTKPKTNNLFWSEKISRNMKRDKEVTSFLEAEGWIVIRLWEHEVEKSLKECVDRILKKIKSQL
ncbi:MAG: very short patch repair endonuclease [Desulfovibrionaceae bacterium]|nr:very short patch repair endonuclease [Desulfovibrionaceae bacterium]